MTSGSCDPELKSELKKLIISACDREFSPDTLTDDEPLVGRNTRLELDSLDILQINVAVAQRYGVRIEDSKHAMRVMKNINTLADFIRPSS